MAAALELPTGARGRLLAAAILFLVLGGLYLLIVAPALSLYNEREDTLADRRVLLPRLRAVGGTLPALRAQAGGLRSAANNARVTLDGTSDAVVSADLQSRIGELAASAGITIGSAEALVPENRGIYRRIGLRIAATGEYAALVKLLATIEQATPPLVLGELQMHGSTRPVGPGASAQLDASFAVFGFRKGDPATTPKQ